MTPFFIGRSVLCATNTVVRSFFGRKFLPETQHFPKNNIFSFFNQKISKSAIKVVEPKYTSFLDQLINYISLIIPINSNNTATFASWISRFFGKKLKNYCFFWKCRVSGLQHEHNIACPKNNLTTVFVAQILTHLSGWNKFNSRLVQYNLNHHSKLI